MTGGNPFYVTEVLAFRTAAEPPPSVANAVLGRASRLDDADRRLVELVSVVPTRVRASLLDVVMPGWPSAAVEPERRRLLDVDSGYVRFRHELARHAIRSRLPIVQRRRLHGEILEALLDSNADPADIVHHAEAAGADDVVAVTHSSPRDGQRRSARIARRTPTTGAPRTSPIVCLRRSRRSSSRSWRRRRTSWAGSTTHSTRSSVRFGSTAISATTRPWAAARGTCHGFTGSRATATQRGSRRARRSRSSSRSASPSSWAAPTAGCPSSGCSRRTRTRRLHGATRRSSSRLASATRGRAPMRSSTSAPRGFSWIERRSPRCSRRTRSRTPPGTGTRPRERSSISPTR